MNFKTLQFFVIALIFSASAQAEVTLSIECGVSPTGAKVKVSAFLKGPITKESGKRVTTYFESLFRPQFFWEPCSNYAKAQLSFSIVIDSTGGDIDSALIIAEKLLSLGPHGYVNIPQDAKCLSACVLILAGAQNRRVHPSSTVGIHRPYLPEATPISRSNMQAMYSALTKRLQDFFDRAGADGTLAQHMMRVPPEQMQVLSTEQMTKYGLLESSAAVQESNAMDEALSLGISRQELAQRTAHARRVCGPDACKAAREVTEACVNYVWCMKVQKGKPAQSQ